MSTHSREIFVRIAIPTLKSMDLDMLRRIPHHTTSRLTHCLHVAYISYLLSCKFGCDSEVVVRGALLHDYFRESGKRSVALLLRHPSMSVVNASRIFSLTEVERDVIKKHMFPLTLIPPRFAESWIVNSVDKYCAIIEYLTLLKTPYFRDLQLLAQTV